MPSLLGDVRRFNRTVTEHIGVLADHFLGRGLNPGRGPPALGDRARGQRAAHPCGPGSASTPATSPGWCAASPTRGLVTVVPSPADRRSRLARLTKKGLAERARLDERSDEFAQGLLDPLTEDAAARAGRRDAHRAAAAGRRDRRDPGGRSRAPGRAALPGGVLRRARRPVRDALRPDHGLDGRARRGASAARRLRGRLPPRDARWAAARSSTTRAASATSSGCGCTTARVAWGGATAARGARAAGGRARRLRRTPRDQCAAHRGDRALPVRRATSRSSPSTTSPSPTTGSRRRCEPPRGIVGRWLSLNRQLLLAEAI